MLPLHRASCTEKLSKVRRKEDKNIPNVTKNRNNIINTFPVAVTRGNIIYYISSPLVSGEVALAVDSI